MRLIDTVNTYIENYLKNHEIYSVYGTIKEIKDDKCTVTIDKGADIFDVTMYLGNFQIVPKKGSKCIVTFTSPTDAFLSMIEKIDTLKMGTNSIEFNGGNNGGLVLVNSLVSRLNAIENDINTLKGIMATWVPIPLAGGAGLKIASAAWAGKLLTPTQKTQIENTKIKQ